MQELNEAAKTNDNPFENDTFSKFSLLPKYANLMNESTYVESTNRSQNIDYSNNLPPAFIMSYDGHIPLQTTD